MNIAPALFQQVSSMNLAFENPFGGVNYERLKSQCENLLDECNELRKAIQEKNIVEVRDAACDIAVFAFGALHLMGVDYNGTAHKRHDFIRITAKEEIMDMWDRLADQTYNFDDMYSNLMIEIEYISDEDMNPYAQGAKELCEMIQFSASIYHVLNEENHPCSFEADMTQVYESNMSKFCKDEKELKATIAKYDKLGVKTIVCGEFPRKFLRSAETQVVQGTNYPAHKFLKGVGFFAPVFA